MEKSNQLNKYLSYNNALTITEFWTIFVRRADLCLKFAKPCVKKSETKKCSQSQ